MSEQPILIAGAGIAGLTCALALAQCGLQAKILEAFDTPEEIGAGIQVPPNAWRVLAALGLGDELVRHVVMPSSICLGDAHSGEILLDMPVNRDDRSGNNFGAIHRAQLHKILWDTAQKSAQIEIVTSCKVERVVEKQDHVEVTCNTPVGEQVENSSILIGADGIWSNVRRYVKDSQLPQPTGRIALRAMVPSHDAHKEPIVSAWMGPKCHVVTYPVQNGNTLNIVAIINGAAHSGSWSQKISGPLPEDLSHTLAHITPLGIDEIEFMRWPLYAVSPAGAWHSNRICLIGDAAHGMEPFAAQGAAMGIEDAYVLAKKLDTFGTANSNMAFSKFRDTRLERVIKVSKRTEFNRVAYHQSGIGRMVRNAIFKWRKPEDFLSNMDWLYGFDATR